MNFPPTTYHRQEGNVEFVPGQMYEAIPVTGQIPEGLGPTGGECEE